MQDQSARLEGLVAYGERERVPFTFDRLNSGVANFHARVLAELSATDLSELTWWRAVSRHEVVDVGRRRVPGMAGVEENHPLARAAQRQRGCQNGWATARNGDIENAHEKHLLAMCLHLALRRTTWEHNNG